MSIRSYAGLILGVAGGFVVGLDLHPTALVDPATALVPVEAVRLAAPGRVEGLSETINIGAGLEGVIETVDVAEGMFVRRGTLLARFACEDLKATADVANAEREALGHVRARLLRGSRDEERSIAHQDVVAAVTLRDHAQAVFARSRALRDEGLISAAEFEKVSSELLTATANLQVTEEREKLVEAPALSEEVARADANVQAAVKRSELAQTRIEKCDVRAPVDGTVVSVLARAGESYSVNMPRPLFRLADCRGRRVRAEVDERDVPKVTLGQRVIVVAEGYSGRPFDGKVIQTAHVMGRKTVRTGDPAEKSDRDILEVVIALPSSALLLPIGLRVTARFLANQEMSNGKRQQETQ